MNANGLMVQQHAADFSAHAEASTGSQLPGWKARIVLMLALQRGPVARTTLATLLE